MSTKSCVCYRFKLLWYVILTETLFTEIYFCHQKYQANIKLQLFFREISFFTKSYFQDPLPEN